MIGVSPEPGCGRLLLSGCENVVDVESPQASRRSSHEVFCRTGRIFGRDRDLVVDETGRIVRETRAASEPQALSEALGNAQLPLGQIGLEACPLTAWLHDGLRGEGLPAICIETRAANAAMKTMPNKTDRNDARALAQIMRTGWYRQVHVKSRQCRLWRSLLVARRTVLNEMRSRCRSGSCWNWA